jgi:TPR repeat protein
MFSRLVKIVLGSAMLFSVFAFNVQAKDYNNGFLAAEGGDFNSAVQQWGPLAEQGHAIAQFNLALLYHSGLGVDLDEAKAVSWYKKSASNGYYKAQEYLAVGYREGWFGLPKDSKKASYWEKQLEANTR